MHMGDAGIEVPEGLRFRDHGHSIEIVRPWYQRRRLLHLAAVGALTGGLSLWVAVIIQVNVMVGMYFLFIVAGCMYAGYRLLAGLVNRTRISATPQSLVTEHSPLWWPGGREIATSAISEVYFRPRGKPAKYYSRGYVGHRFRTEHEIPYQVHAILNTGEDIPLMRGIDSREQALFIKQKIVDYLQIGEDPWPDEAGRHYA